MHDDCTNYTQLQQGFNDDVFPRVSSVDYVFSNTIAARITHSLVTVRRRGHAVTRHGSLTQTMTTLRYKTAQCTWQRDARARPSERAAIDYQRPYIRPFTLMWQHIKDRDGEMLGE